MPDLRSFAAISFGVLAIAACGKSSSATPTATPTPHSSAGQISAIVSSGSSCKQFSAGTIGELTRIQYTKSATKIARITPPTFDYWVKVASASSPLTTLTMVETTQGTTGTVTSSGGDVFSTAEGAGTCVVVSNSVSYVGGVTKVSFAGTKGTTYFVQVHYSTAPLVGETLAAGSATLTVSTSEVSNSSKNFALTSG